jgi:DNA-binding LacI/PurR family transcriptional regulator
LIDNKIGGIIFAEGISMNTIERASKYTETVLIDRHFKEDFVSEVSSDNYSGGRQAVEYLLQLNHKRIGFISGPENWPSAEERYRGYRDALSAFNIPFNPDLLFRGDLRFESGISALEYFLTLSEWPTAIFSANDQMALGVLNKSKILNISIPEDISLVGFDNIPYYSLYNTDLTTVEQDIPALCESAFNVMMKKIDGENKADEEKRIVIPTKLRIGETCRKLI